MRLEVKSWFGELLRRGSARVAALATLPMLLCSAQAYADGPTIEIAAGEVYLDTTTGKFSGRLKLGHEDTDINQVAIIAPENANVVIGYWEKESGCPAANLTPNSNLQFPTDDTLVVRSAAPTGAVVARQSGREQKFVARVGPLSVGKKYCFAYRITSKRALLPDEQTKVDQAFDKTVDTLATALSSGAQSAAAQGTDLAGSPNRWRQARLCSAALGKPSITASELADLFICSLGWPNSTWTVSDPVTKNTISIQDAVAYYVNQDPALGKAVQLAVTARSAAFAARKAIEDVVDQNATAADSLMGIEKAWPMVVGPPAPVGPAPTPRPIEYDPVPNIQLAAFKKTLVDEQLKKTFEAVPAGNRRAFTHALYENALDVSNPTKRTPAPTQAAALAQFNSLQNELDAFLRAKPEAKPISITQQAVTTLRTTLAGNLDDAAKRQAGLDALGLPSAADLQTLVGFVGSADQARLTHLANVVDRLRKDHAQLEQKQKDAKALKNADSFQDLKGRISAITQQSGGGNFAAEPSYKERFPFWVTADVGVLTGFFGPKDGEIEKHGVSMSFGLSFYLTAVDKAEPLRLKQWGLCHDFWRRFSVMAGFTLTKPTGVDTLGVGGVLGDRLLTLGAGLRLTDYVRVSSGALFYSQTDPSPLSDRKDIHAAPYIMGSIDLDVLSTVQQWITTAQGARPSGS